MYLNAPERRRLWSLADMQIGARLSLPILPAVTTFGLAVGAAAAVGALAAPQRDDECAHLRTAAN